jgi:hypothetical protein
MSKVVRLDGDFKQVWWEILCKDLVPYLEGFYYLVIWETVRHTTLKKTWIF